MILNIVLTLIGLVMLFGGGEFLVRGATNMAKHMGISALLVSLIVVGFGTSLPELLVCAQAALSGSPDIALGNVAGSNIANTFLILGTAAVISPMLNLGHSIRRDSLVVIAASAFLAGLGFIGIINMVMGAIMLAVLFSYLYWSYISERKNPNAGADNDDDTPVDTMTRSALFTLGGLIVLGLGANFLVTGSTAIAREFGVSEAVIGLTLVALGTSLPELATAVIASMKKQSDIIIGNVLGSNLFNIFAILGTTAIIEPLPVGGRIANIDVWIVLGSAILLFPIMVTGKKISRIEGAIFLALYFAYIGSMFVMDV